MAKVKYISADGSEVDVELSSDNTVMVGAMNNGIDGECSGICACATCHVYVDPAWVDRIPEPDFMDEARLEHAIDRRQNSRLACQIDIRDDLDGLVVRMPERQY